MRRCSCQAWRSAGRGRLHLCTERLGGRFEDRIYRTNHADEFDVTHSAFFMNSSLAPVLRFRSRLKSVFYVLKGIRANGFSDTHPSKPCWETKSPQCTVKDVSVYSVKGLDNVRHEDMEIIIKSVAKNLLNVKRSGIPSINRRDLIMTLLASALRSGCGTLARVLLTSILLRLLENFQRLSDGKG